MVRVLLWDFVVPRVGLGWLSRRTRSARMKSIAKAFRERATQMGGVMIKVGQFLSSRLDVLPREIIEELVDLQDEVGEESFERVRLTVETEFGKSLAEVFENFDPRPLASASIGQVHRARLPPEAAGGEAREVVVKVQRGDIEMIIEADLAAIRVAGNRLQKMRAIRRHANVPALIEEFSRSLHEEIDYLSEGRNDERFAANFEAEPRVVAPRVFWSHTSRRVLTLEYVEAIKITDYAGIEAAGIDRGAVADLLLAVYLKQVFEDGYFHADPHPGNLFVLPTEVSGAAAGKKDWRLVFVDFGMTGTIPTDTFEALREGLIAIGTKNASRLVSSLDRLHMFLPGADMDLIERALARLLDTFWGKSTKDMLSMSESQISSFFNEFGELLYDLPFQIPENLILLGRCISILSGIASGLNPDFSVWKGLSPYIAKTLKESGEGGAKMLLNNLGDLLRLLAGLPKLADDVARKANEGRLEVRTPDLRQQLEKLEVGFRKLAGAIVFAAGLLAWTQFYLGGHKLLALLVGAGEFLLLLWIFFGA